MPVERAYIADLQHGPPIELLLELRVEALHVWRIGGGAHNRRRQVSGRPSILKGGGRRRGGNGRTKDAGRAGRRRESSLNAGGRSEGGSHEAGERVGILEVLQDR